MQYLTPDIGPEVTIRPGTILGAGQPQRPTLGKAIWHLHQARKALEAQNRLETRWRDFLEVLEKYLWQTKS
jgi:hypothetical protein